MGPGPAGAEPAGPLDSLFVDPMARVVPNPLAPSEEPPRPATEDCQARMLLDCFVSGTVQTLSRGAEGAPASDAAAEPPVRDRTPAAPRAPTAPEVVAPEPPAAPAEPPAPPGPPPEIAELRAAIERAGLEGTVTIDDDGTAGVLTNVPPAASE